MKRKFTERGASLVEYSLLVALLAIAAMVSTRVLGQTINTKLSVVADAVGASGGCVGEVCPATDPQL